MGSYENSKIKKKNIIRGENKISYNNITSYDSTVYSSIPESDNDIWVITQKGDRLDLLAHRFYGDVNLWWYIAKANNLTLMTLPTGTSIRIPGNTNYAVGT